MKKLIPEYEIKNEALANLVGERAVRINIDENTTIDLDYQGWPTVCRGDGDTLYVSASLRTQHVDPFGATVFYKSLDGGRTWSEPKIINDTPADDRDSGIVYLGEGKLLVTFFTIEPAAFMAGGAYENNWRRTTPEQKAAKIAQWEKELTEEEWKTSGSFVVLSEDYGETWSKPIRVPVTAPHGPTKLQDGTLLYLGKGEKVQYFPDSGAVEGGFQVFHSADGGKTWQHWGDIPLPPLPELGFEIPAGHTPGFWGYWEPYVIQLQDGSFLGGIRTGCTYGYPVDETRQPYSNMSLGVLITHSKDGKNWSMAEKIECVHGAPPHFLQLRNGAILLTYSYRLPHYGIRGRISYDGGYTWSEEELIISENTDPNRGDLGYPSTVELDDGTLITTYYQAYKNDTNTSVLYTRWRLRESE